MDTFEGQVKGYSRSTGKRRDVMYAFWKALCIVSSSSSVIHSSLYFRSFIFINKMEIIIVLDFMRLS